LLKPSQLLSPVAKKVSNMLARGAVTLVNAANKLQTLQVSLLEDEAKDTLEHLEPYGFTSYPLAGAEVLAAFIEGDRSHGVVIVASDRRYRPVNLQPGDACLYNNLGMTIRITKDGIVITGGAKPINISGVPQVTVTGGDVIADGISLKTHKHGGVQAGGAQTGVPV
jgi:phage baseplate assembly protein V